MLTPHQRYAAATKAANDWNLRVKVGSMVRYWSVARDIGTDYGFRDAATRSEATVIGAHTAVVQLVGVSGAVAISFCRPLYTVKNPDPRCPNCTSARQLPSGDHAFYCVDCGKTWEPDEGLDPTCTANPSRRLERADDQRGPTRDYRKRGNRR